MLTSMNSISAMQIIVLRYRMNTRERKSDRCEGPNHQARRNDFSPFTIKFTISLVSAEISIGRPTTDW